ncbi:MULTISPECIES: signal peptidase II [unclassified Spirosoma]|uniref:signal peptidase II n=1 Tax=unclassified Spirosoma TaxID=2621999 RepID=UPI00095B2219|nr:MULTISPECIES: signal peptidase II [unclassified Spirosoma]MBN8822600.1 signal peptidase II [Spirosoma sp.]OJW74093.1 MAG: signal peptidase II [Spirosoma sp. 48-14]
MKNAIRIFLIILTVSVNIGCDQVSKTIVRDKVSYGERISLVQRHLTLTNVENTGAFLSLGNTWPPLIKNILLLILPILALLVGFAYLILSAKATRLLALGASFIIGGGIGNLIDRAAYGSVTDFLHIRLGLLQTGIFNMADVSVMVGAGLILLDAFLKKDKSQFT